MSEVGIYRADPQEGIVIARILQFYRKPESGLLGVSDREIYENGVLNFNYHPDQWGEPAGYTHGYRGTKVNGLPVRLMTNMEEVVLRVSEGRLSPATALRSKVEGKLSGAILLATFSLEQISNMGLGYNTMFDTNQGQPFTLLIPEVVDNSLLLRIKDIDELIKINPYVRARFDRDGYLLGNDGEFYIPQIPAIEEYRDKILVFRPESDGNSFRQYWIKDVLLGKEGNEGNPNRFYP